MTIVASLPSPPRPSRGLRPPGSTSFGHLLIERQALSGIKQTYTNSNGTEMYFRAGSGGAWSAWRRIYHDANLLGPVSQSGGTPTGAVIESGSNANGRYTRWADGTQICTNDNAAITTAPAAFTGTITKIDSDKLWIGRWF